MAELVRWCSEGGGAPEGVRELLEAASPLAPMPYEAHVKAVACVTELASAKAAPVLTLLSGKTLSAALVGGVTCAAVAFGTPPDRPEKSSTLASQPAAQVATVAATAAAPKPAAPETPVEEPDDVVAFEDLPEATGRETQPKSSVIGRQHDAQAISGGRLSEEATLVERARRSVAGNPALALSLSRQHARRFPQGQLRSASRSVAIEALRRLGRADEARAHARVLLAEQPRGLYAERARRLLDGR